jgi:monofunctional biosynthetic peptidoglycan transglycosylase
MARTRAEAAPPAPAHLRTWALRALVAVVGALALSIVAYAVVAPPGTLTMLGERIRLGGIERSWVPMEAIAPVAARAVVAAEDANFCRHWGFDMAAIRSAIDEGGRRGASTLSQQTVKNVFLWQGRSWPRKALEAAITPVVELVWSKRRIVELYLNVAEMGEGVFGIEAAARHWFGVAAADLSGEQAARIAAILPSPRDRSPAEPSDFVRRRAAQILDGAETIRRDGRAQCFEG